MMKKMISKGRDKKRFADLVGVDFSTTGTKVARLKQSKDGIALAGMDLLPAVDFDQTASRVELPRNITSHYGCLAYTGSSAVVRMVNTRLEEGENVSEPRLRELLNVTDEYRVSARVIKRGKGRQDSSLLAAAIPDDDARYLVSMFPSGPPAPASLEISGLAFVSAFLHSRGAECAESTVCLLDAGESISHFVFLNKGEISLVGKMPLGAAALRGRLAKDLGVDDELAASILNDRSINISSSLANVLEPFIKQLSISKDFIERHQGCRVARIYLSGGLSLLPTFADEVGGLLNSEVVSWSPLEKIQCDEGIISDELAREATRFSAAIGAAIGGFES